jgi:hypothetical protein
VIDAPIAWLPKLVTFHIMTRLYLLLSGKLSIHVAEPDSDHPLAFVPM